MSRVIIPRAVLARDHEGPAALIRSLDQHRRELIQYHRLAVFALLFLLIAGPGIWLIPPYLSADTTRVSPASAAVRVPPPPAKGPNMAVASSQLATTIDRVTSQTLKISIDDETVAAKPEVIREWLQIVTDKTKKVSYIHVSDDAVARSLQSLAEPFIKAPINPISLTRSDGTTSVIGNGRNGFDLGDSSDARRQISDSLLGAKGLRLELPMQSVAFETVSADTVDKLLEIDVISKQLWAYDKGQLSRSFPISAGAPETPTPLGQFKIYQKLPVQDMRGFNVDGTQYFQPNVRWVNYFLTGGYAVHGNYWRSQSWFGVINSSHGCVSLPDPQAKWIYDWAPIGTTVIVHA